MNAEHAIQNAVGHMETIAALLFACDESNWERKEELEELLQERKDRRDELETELNCLDEDEGESLSPEDMAELEELRRGALSQEDSEELENLHSALMDYDNAEDAAERIQEYPLSIQIRSGWTTPGEDMQAEEFEILLTTGGPALRIVGELDEYKQPSRSRLEYQDWGIGWTEHVDADRDTLDAFAAHFWFGE